MAALGHCGTDILTQWQHPLASSEALDARHWVIGTALQGRIHMAVETASKCDVFCCCQLFVCAKPKIRTM